MLVSLLTMPGERLVVRGTPFMWRERAEHECELVLDCDAARAVRFRAQAGRLGVGMVVVSRRSAIDISRQPQLLWSLLSDASVQHDCPEGQLHRRVSLEIQSFAAANGVWTPRDNLVEGPRLTLGTGYPLLGQALDRGAAAILEVPRWAAPVLAAPTAREAVVAGFASKTTRRLVRALPLSICPPEGDEAPRIRLLPLGLALMARELLDPDRLAAVLERGAAADTELRWPDVDLIQLGREQLPSLGVHGAAQVLRDVADHESGVRLLAVTLSMLQRVRPQLPARLPNGLEALHETCRRVAPVDPAPRAFDHDSRPEAADLRSAAVEQSLDQNARQRSRTSVTRREVVPGASVEVAERHVHELFGTGTTQVAPPLAVHSPALEPPNLNRRARSRTARGVEAVRAIDGLEIGEQLQLTLPRTVAELTEWGLQLRNCVGSFGPAVARGESTIIGVRRNGRLTYCLELTTRNEIRQFLGERNRQVPGGDACVVVRALLDHQLLDRSRNSNSPWLAAAEAL